MNKGIIGTLFSLSLCFTGFAQAAATDLFIEAPFGKKTSILEETKPIRFQQDLNKLRGSQEVIEVVIVF